jgi:hypothetical protein
MTMYVVRVAGKRSGSLHGTVRHAATGETQKFAGGEELLRVIAEWQATHDLDAMLEDRRDVPGPGPERDYSPRRRLSKGPAAAARRSS